MDILRFITAGSIDDGKSTLIGRLLLNTGNIKSDILNSISGTGKHGKDINLAFVTDGLRAERQGGITIDVAYKYFTTPHRKYIITDAPGHFQYTKNLVTGASGVDAIIILIDAVNGITEQTRRHSLVASFLKTGHVVIAINKMDLVAYDENVFLAIKNEYLMMAEQLGLKSISFIPISALNGDNVNFRSTHMPWFTQKTLLGYLEDCMPVLPENTTGMRFRVQYSRDGNCYGKLVAGTISRGDTVLINPAGKQAIVKTVNHGYDTIEIATAGQDICLTFEDGAAVTRGGLLSHITDPPQCADEFDAELCWLDETMPLEVNKEYILRTNTSETLCRVIAITSITDNGTFIKYNGATRVRVNEFADVRIRANDKVAYDKFTDLRETGRGILIDKDTNNTSGALIIF